MSIVSLATPITTCIPGLLVTIIAHSWLGSPKHRSKTLSISPFWLTDKHPASPPCHLDAANCNLPHPFEVKQHSKVAI
ncbi:Hypothetical predicted protein [Podarcis lilfordi]|uniref:Uncharacterized protein n=1 Tax=Podarcis lilfordi TaxID=74358 RepID=A0AA35KCX6_9SAUR|nr:Hypothetical predicted protein [Podarcis lilfordi]